MQYPGVRPGRRYSWKLKAPMPQGDTKNLDNFFVISYPAYFFLLLFFSFVFADRLIVLVCCNGILRLFKSVSLSEVSLRHSRVYRLITFCLLHSSVIFSAF